MSANITQPSKRKWPVRYTIGEMVRIVNLESGREFRGEVISLEPMKAKVTESDPVWHGCEVEGTYLRKVRKG